MAIHWSGHEYRIASEAKQSIFAQKEEMDCFVARAPRNDELIGQRSFVMFRLATAALLSIAFAAPVFAADTKPHRVAIQVNQNEPQVMNLALNNATNALEYYRGKNEEVEIDIV